MKRHPLLTLVVVSIFIVGCTLETNHEETIESTLPFEKIATITPNAISKVTSTIEVTPSAKPTLFAKTQPTKETDEPEFDESPISTISPPIAIRKQCLKLYENIPIDDNLQGTLILEGEFSGQGFFLDLKTQNMRNMLLASEINGGGRPK